MSTYPALSQITRPRLLSAAIAGLLLMPGARAATLTVNSTADPGNGGTCTLRQAIDSVNAVSNQGGCVAVGAYDSNDTILFNPSVTGTIKLSGTQLLIQKDLVIDGPGATQLAVDGDAKSRVFSIPGGTSVAPRNVTIEGLTIRNGRYNTYSGGGISLGSNVSLTLTDSAVSGNSAGDVGGGVYADENNTLTLTNSTVSGNSAGNGGGGILANSGNTLTLINSTVSGNTAGAGGGGILANSGNTLTLINSTVSGNSAAYSGGGVVAVSDNTLTLTNSTVSGNSATSSGGGVSVGLFNLLTLTNSTVSGNSAEYGGGGVFTGKYNTLTLTNSTVSRNSAGYDGGGVSAVKYNTLTLTNSTVSRNSAGYDGGGVSAVENNTLTLTNSTVSGNSATSSGGGVSVGLFNLLTLTNSTVSGNSAEYGGGVFVVGLSNLTLTNTILANSTGGDCLLGLAGVTGTFNLVEDTGDNACGLVNGVDGNIVGRDPRLSSLADNGCVIPSGVPGTPAYGCVQTHALLAGSPALNTANATVCAAPPVNGIDQRGTSRPQGSGCDIGAYEGVADAQPVPAVSSGSLLGGAGLLGLLGAWRMRRQTQRRGR